MATFTEAISGKYRVLNVGDKVKMIRNPNGWGSEEWDGSIIEVMTVLDRNNVHVRCIAGKMKDNESSWSYTDGSWGWEYVSEWDN